jgi:hypothetical protein
MNPEKWLHIINSAQKSVYRAGQKGQAFGEDADTDFAISWK